MITSIFMVLAALSQVPFYGEIPENVPTFKMTFADGTVAYGALAVDGQWYEQDVVSLPPGKTPTLVFDTPWAPQQDRPLRQPEFVAETRSLRKQRLTEDWKAAGYSPVQTKQGEFYAPKEEIALAERAREMEAAVAQAANVFVAPSDISAPPTTPTQQPGLLQRWGMHAAVLGVGLLITGIVFRKFVLDAG
jgi:hypothetical protein